MPLPRLITTRDELRATIATLRAAGKTLGLVPTMGALHAGHLSLAHAARRECDVVAATIFVNPTQFAPHEDFQKYPRTLDADRELLADARTDFVFVPDRDEMYPPGFSTYVEPPEVAAPLEGRCRPGHFRGVTTVVLKLFQLVPADVAYFGHKDYQQSLVIRRMATDLNLPIRVAVCPTVREPDGLAMSSRNRYLSPSEREQALALSRGLRLATELFRGGERDATRVRSEMENVLKSAGITRIEYISLSDPETLMEVSRLDQPTIGLIAAFVGTTRLIDNVLLEN